MGGSWNSTGFGTLYLIYARAGGVLDFDEVLDTTGLVCPEPLMLVRNAVRKMMSGAVLRVIATDPTTDRDFQHFCQFMGHSLLTREQTVNAAGQVVLLYWIQKKVA